MKTFQPITFDLPTCQTEVAELSLLLKSNPTLKERDEILPFFKTHPQLSALCGHYNPNMGRHDLVAWEYDLFGDFACDLVIGDSLKKSFAFLEFEDAGPNSLFVQQGKKVTREWSDRFDHGYSQIIDWFCKIDGLRRTPDHEARFGKPSIDFVGILVVGRDHFITPPEKNRLDWRRENVVIQSKRVICVTFDELAKDLTERLNYFHKAAKAIRKRSK